MALTERQIEEFRQRLVQMRQQILTMVQAANHEALSTEERSGYSQHMADEGTDECERTVSLEVSGCEYKVLRQIERALQKITENTYGVCDVSGEAIPLARLEAIPYATMTVQAQEKFEKSSR